MDYTKPEITLMGCASLTIRGYFFCGKVMDPDAFPSYVFIGDCELDD